jgi:hypothetical protein
MGKGRQKQSLGHVPHPQPSASSAQTATSLTTTTSVASDPILGYKLRVLLHDFTNVTKDPTSEHRINQTMDEHYISLPYFNDDEAAIIKSAIVDLDISSHTARLAADAEAIEGEETDSLSSETLKGKSFDEVVRKVLSNFIDKRRASGDARPCGPHHLSPLYASLFGVDIEEIKEEKFLRRLRRCGL